MTHDQVDTSQLFEPVENWARDHIDGYKASIAAHSFDLTDEQMTSYLRYDLNAHLDEAFAQGCMDDVVRRYYAAIVQVSSYKDLASISIANVAVNWQGPQRYWINHQDFKDRLKTVSTKELEAIARIQSTLRKRFVRQLDGIGRADLFEYMEWTYRRTQLNLLASATEILTVGRDADHVDVTYHSVGKPDVVRKLALTDGVQLSIYYYLHEDLPKLLADYFPNVVVNLADPIAAVILRGGMDLEVAENVIANPKFAEVKNKAFKDTVKFFWGVTKQVLYADPYTLPFITLGTLIYQAVSQKNAFRKQGSDATHVVP